MSITHTFYVLQQTTIEAFELDFDVDELDPFMSAEERRLEFEQRFVEHTDLAYFATEDEFAAAVESASQYGIMEQRPNIRTASFTITIDSFDPEINALSKNNVIYLVKQFRQRQGLARNLDGIAASVDGLQRNFNRLYQRGFEQNVRGLLLQNLAAVDAGQANQIADTIKSYVCKP